ncbi:hypothetical protein A9O63_03810 [Cereibacter johrii]|nr:hypothetical protein A9O63_03810 [Cereibacter johrii]
MIAIEDEFEYAELSQLSSSAVKQMQRELPDSALEGMDSERRVKIRKRAAWIVDRFIRIRQKEGALTCDDCGFDPISLFSDSSVSPRRMLDVHHKCPMQEGIRYTTVNDFALLCPTCHRAEHARQSLLA